MFSGLIVTLATSSFSYFLPVLVSTLTFHICYWVFFNNETLERNRGRNPGGGQPALGSRPSVTTILHGCPVCQSLMACRLIFKALSIFPDMAVKSCQYRSSRVPIGDLSVVIASLSSVDHDPRNHAAALFQPRIHSRNSRAEQGTCLRSTSSQTQPQV